MDKAEYAEILKEHGLRVANRVAYAAMGNGAEHGLGDFYAMYGSEDELPEHERCKTGMIDKFDPTGWNKFYSHAARHGPPHWISFAESIKGTSRDWLSELTASTSRQAAYLHALFHSDDARQSASEEWLDFLESLNDADIVALFIILNGRMPGAAEQLLPREAEISDLYAKLTSNKKESTK